MGNVIYCQIFREVKESLERSGELKFSLARGGGGAPITRGWILTNPPPNKNKTEKISVGARALDPQMLSPLPRQSLSHYFEQILHTKQECIPVGCVPSARGGSGRHPPGQNDRRL